MTEPWWRHHRAPVTLIAGYLGAGKTTLMNHLLATSGRKLAVLVNDVGTVNVDAALVRSHDGQTIELTDGCVCCSLVDGFAGALESLRSRPAAPDHVVVELSGVAEPARVVPWTRTPGFTLDAVVTLVDPDTPVRAEDVRLRQLVDAQIAAADIVVLTKTDTVGAAAGAATRQWAVDRVGDRPIIESAGVVAADLVLGHGGSGAGAGAAATLPAGGHLLGHFTPPRAWTLDGLEAWIGTLGADVVRVKGVVELDTGRVLVQRVGLRTTVVPTEVDATGLVTIALPPR